MVTMMCLRALGHPKPHFLRFLSILKYFDAIFQNRTFYLEILIFPCRGSEKLENKVNQTHVQRLTSFSNLMIRTSPLRSEHTKPILKTCWSSIFDLLLQVFGKSIFLHHTDVFIRKSLLKYAMELQKNGGKTFFFHFLKTHHRLDIWLL